MFTLTQETKDAIIAYLRESGLVKDDASDETLEVAIDNIVTIVKI